MIGLMLVTTGVLQELMTRSINIFLRPVSAQNVRPETTACKADKRSGPGVAADSAETKPKSRESLNGTAAPSGEASHASVARKSASPVDVVGRPAPVNLPHQSSLVPTPAPSTDGQDARCLTTQIGASKKVTLAPSTDDRDAQRPPDKSGPRKKETFGGMKPGFLSGGTAGGTKAKEAQKVGKMRRGGRRQVPAKSREAAKSHKSGNKKATEKKARLEQEAAQIADMHAVASLLTAFPNARIGTSVSPAMYPLTPNIVFRAPISNE
uniref:Uncharacterized protein n=1 Tax=Branchiostoma floridae TaxID=7739 RepID=C3ZI56_BRAFL|eukprot:XP_002591787.1 hypothetical protein BRAFLDRAFT_83567 [Branchiostoma floridae]